MNIEVEPEHQFGENSEPGSVRQFAVPRSRGGMRPEMVSTTAETCPVNGASTANFSAKRGKKQLG